MKISFCRGILFLLIVLFAWSATARAQSTDSDSCSMSTLKGDYAFTVYGQIFLPNGTIVTRDGVAMTHFDGAGYLTQVDFVLSSPNAPAPPPGMPPTDPVTKFHTEEKGSYTVNQDCTGNFEIDFPPTTDPSTGKVSSGAIIKVMFVLSNHGRTIHTIVYSLQPPGAPGPVPALIHSEGYKLGAVPGQRD
jgi:hypothetical protein